jgi:hypothetical protein
MSRIHCCRFARNACASVAVITSGVALICSSVLADDHSPLSCSPAWNPTIGQPGMNTSVGALAVFNDQLHAGGLFTSAGGVPASRIARWSESSGWAALGPGLNNEVQSLKVFDGGDGPHLYVGGTFTAAGQLPASRIARWDGSDWSALGTGVDGPSGVSVRAMAVFDDGNGPALFVGGVFTSAGGVVARRIARWHPVDGWSAPGTGVTGSPVSVDALAVFDDGNGEALYIGGAFTTANGMAVNNIVRYDGTTWSALGSGIEGGAVRSMAVFDDGNGPALYVGGDFNTAGGQPAARIARWDGSSWSTLGSGLSGGLVGAIALVVHDDGSTFADGNPVLFVAGGFGSAGGVSANNIARWNGQQWAAVGNGLTGGVFPTVTSLAVHNSPLGPGVAVGGLFNSAGSQSSVNIARWIPTQNIAITAHPEDTSVDLGSPLLLEVTAVGTGSIAYQWRHEGVPLVDDGRITGATTSQLSIDPAQPEDVGEYDVLVMHACGTITSKTAFVDVVDEPCLPADLNCDGVVNVSDLLILFDNWGDCSNCGDCPADLNDDCVVNVSDLLILFDQWG